MCNIQIGLKYPTSIYNGGDSGIVYHPRATFPSFKVGWTIIQIPL